MAWLAQLWPFAVLALVGAAHCAGMCGGFAVALVARGGRRALVVRQLAFVLGKATTYALLGLVAATAGGLLAHGGLDLHHDAAATVALRLERLRAVLAWVAGLTLVGFGLAAWGLRLPLRLPPRATRWAARAWTRVATQPGLAGPLGGGLLAGLLPCGLSWSALALAAALPPATAAAGLYLFGLGTAPALVLVGLGWSGLGVRWRARVARAVGPLLVAFGLLTVARGGLPGTDAARDALLPPCCAAQD